MKGGSGFQTGLGFWLTRNLLIEFMVKTHEVEMTINDTTNNVYINYTEATNVNTSLVFKIVF